MVVLVIMKVGSMVDSWMPRPGKVVNKLIVRLAATQNLVGKPRHYCQTPVLGLGLGVDFTFGWDNNNNNKKKKKNPHLNFRKRNSS